MKRGREESSSGNQVPKDGPMEWNGERASARPVRDEKEIIYRTLFSGLLHPISCPFSPSLLSSSPEYSEGRFQEFHTRKRREESARINSSVIKSGKGNQEDD